MTVADNLIMLSPSGKIIFKLKKVRERRLLISLAGVHDIYEVGGEELKTGIYSQANSTQLQFCGGRGVVDYKISRNNAALFTIKEVKGCRENALFSALYRTRYLRRYKD